MWLRVLAWTIACLAIAAGAAAEARTTWFGPQLAFPVPAGEVGDGELGIDAGVTLMRMTQPRVGIGVDLAYHYWPASPEYRAVFDRHLRNTRYQELDSANWAFTALQLTGHLKLVVPMFERHGPWAQVGVGVYRVNRNLAEPNWDGSVAWLEGGDPSNVSVVPGWNLGFGYDFQTGSSLVLGLEAKFHHLWPEHDDLPRFSAVTVGTHVLFGR